MFFFFGLGNPKAEFKRTPHNIGFEIVDYLREEYQGSKWKKKRLSLISEIQIENENVLLIKPLTFMNLSGNAVNIFIEKDGLQKENCLIIFDDINLSLGKLRLKLKGSSGGHKGMASIINVFGTNEIPRLRIGIGPKVSDATIFVLTPFSKKSWRKIEEIFPKIREGLKIYIKNKNDAMQYFNTFQNNSNRVKIFT